MDPLYLGAIGILVFFVFLALKMPIAYAMAIVGFAGYSALTSPEVAFRIVSKDLYSTFSSYSLSVAPMFILMGLVAFRSGIGGKLYNFAYKLIGHFPGGLAIATQATCALFGAICGSNTATAATIGSIALPEMKKYKYDASLSTASVGAGGVLGVLIPPSTIFIVYGVATQVSIGKLFVAGIVPGILLMLFYMAAIFYMVRKNPELGPAGEKSTWKERGEAFRTGLWELAIILVVSLGGLFAGYFTPTEAGAVGAASIILVSFLEKSLSWENFKLALSETTRTTAMIMLLIAGATIFGRFMAISRLPFELATMVGNLPVPSFVAVIIVLAICLVLGCIIDALALVMLTIPIFFPVVVDTLGYDPVWFGVIMVMVVAMGVITPPVGMNIYILKGIAPEIPLETMFRGIWPFLLMQVLLVLIMIAIPGIATFLPNLIY